MAEGTQKRDESGFAERESAHKTILYSASSPVPVLLSNSIKIAEQLKKL